MGQQIGFAEIKEFKNSYLKSNIDWSLNSPVDFNPHTPVKKSMEIFTSYKDDTSEIQDIINQSFKNSGFISSETWDISTQIQARILGYSSLLVTCECLVDKENEVLELRDFPANLFSHLNLDKIEFVLIRLREKPGSSRIDILKADNIIDKSFFEIKDIWEDIKQSGIDQPFQLDD